MKKVCFVLLLTLLLTPLFADNYSIRIVNSDTLTLSDSFIALDGKVELAIDKKDEQNSQRKLTCDSVRIDMDEQTLLASGDVLLTDGKEGQFKGDSLFLNWDSLDVLVFVGTSTTDRLNASGETVTFYSKAKTISYSGEENVVFFSDGVIATNEKEYWSVKAKTIALLDSDLAFANATIRIGYVPVMWVPFFFYPGTTIAFNPAMGIESEKGFFLNTTTEIYGKYPQIKTTSSSSEEEVGASVFSFMNDNNQTPTVRDGIFYRPVKENEEYSHIQKWAKDTSSYFAFFADAFENEGISVGFETDNKFLKTKNLKVYAISDLAIVPKDLRVYGDKALRYYFDTKISYSFDKASFSLELPLMSDPNVSYDFLNRNTVFGLDSVFKKEQFFPSNYASGRTSYTWKIDGSYSYSFKNQKFSLSSVSSQVKYKWNNDKQKYNVSEVILPSFNVQLSGTILTINRDRKLKNSDYTYKTDTAEFLANELDKYNFDYKVPEDSKIKPFEAPVIDFDDQTVENLNLLTVKYSLSEKLSNNHGQEFKHDKTSSNLSGNLNLSGTLSPSWFSYTQNFTTTYSTVNQNNGNTKGDFKINSSLTLNSKELGLSYSLGLNLISVSEANKKVTKKPIKWDKNSFTSHSLSFSKKFGDFSVAFKQTIKPLDMINTPSVSFSRSGFTASADIALYLEKNQIFKKGSTNLKFSYSNSIVSAGITSKYNFAEKGWKGFSVNQNASLNLKEKSFSASESISADNNFKMNNLKLGVNWSSEPAYFWKNRIGIEGSLSAQFLYDFKNPYGSYINSSASVKFAVSKFVDLKFSISSSNNSFYKYYDSHEKFKLGSMLKDLGKSLLIFEPEKLKQTGFVIDQFNLSVVHYMEDWDLYFDASAGLTVKNGKYIWNPKATVLIKWNAVPEMKTENSWSRLNNWEK